MSRSARFTGVFGDGKQEFQLNIGELEELQEKTDAGPEEVFDRLAQGRWKVADIRDTIRLGLKGAGMDPMRALVMVERYAAPGNLAPLKALAQNIIAAALIGAPDEDKPLGEPGAGETNHSPAESSGSEPSTKSEAPSGSPQTKSPEPQSGD